MHLNRKITKIVSLIIVMGMIVYSSLIIGTLFHEFTHTRHSINPHFVQINYDTSGVTSAQEFTESDENQAYFNGTAITISLILLSQFALFILIRQ
jgi:hypothetical protein